MASTGGARCTTLSREGVLSDNLLRTSNARHGPASHRGVSTAVTTWAGLAESSSSPATSRRSCADPTIADQTRDRCRTRGVGPRASTPRSSARRGPRNTSMETRHCRPWSPTAHRTPGPTSEDAVVRRSAGRSNPSARRSSSDSGQHLGRRADVAIDVASPMLGASDERPPRRRASPPKRARPGCFGARAPPHRGKTAVRRPAPRCQPRHADCPGDQATERRPREPTRCRHRDCARSTPDDAAAPPSSTRPRRIRRPADGSASSGGRLGPQETLVRQHTSGTASQLPSFNPWQALDLAARYQPGASSCPGWSPKAPPRL